MLDGALRDISRAASSISTARVASDICIDHLVFDSASFESPQFKLICADNSFNEVFPLGFRKI